MEDRGEGMISYVKLLKHLAGSDSSDYVDRDSVKELRDIGKPIEKLTWLEKHGLVQEEQVQFGFVGDKDLYTDVLKVTDRGYTVIRFFDAFSKPIAAILITASSIVLAWLVLTFGFGVGE